MANKAGKGGGSKKHGRNSVVCAKYRAAGRREQNKRRKAAKQAKIVAKKRAKLAARASMVATVSTGA